MSQADAIDATTNTTASNGATLGDWKLISYSEFTAANDYQLTADQLARNTFHIMCKPYRPEEHTEQGDWFLKPYHLLRHGLYLTEWVEGREPYNLPTFPRCDGRDLCVVSIRDVASVAPHEMKEIDYILFTSANNYELTVDQLVRNSVRVTCRPYYPNADDDGAPAWRNDPYHLLRCGMYLPEWVEAYESHERLGSFPPRDGRKVYIRYIGDAC